ncbi:MAG: hypothetical protein AMJ81_06935 [Phycisphaerae bacterium SM23_33]|nr:MAG: hypothetical protein AMJ81_06935 [Phycisphaerae bacterium SM23_33]
MGYDLMTFGEAMVRLAAPSYMRLEQARSLDVSVGGAEWNVAVNAARLGLKTAWCSRLVDNWAGRLIRNGFYHLELGAGPRPSSVTYDRGHSAVSQMTADMVDWKALLSETRWLHISGITPALSPTLAETVLEVFQTTSQCNIRTSYDLNYRGKLWTPPQAQQANARIVPFVQVLIGNEEDFEKCLGIRAQGTGKDYSALGVENYQQVAREAVKRFANIRMVGTTLRQARTGLLNDWQTLLYDGQAFHVSRRYEGLEIIDRVGGGDSFSAAVIYGLLKGWAPAETNEFAAAYSALAHTFPGDINWATYEEAVKVMGARGARISR